MKKRTKYLLGLAIVVLALVIAVPVVALNGSVPAASGTIKFVNAEVLFDPQAVIDPKGPTGSLAYTVGARLDTYVTSVAFTATRLKKNTTYTLVNDYAHEGEDEDLYQVYVLGSATTNKLGALCIKGTPEKLAQWGWGAWFSGAELYLVEGTATLCEEDSPHLVVNRAAIVLWGLVGLPVILPTPTPV